MVRAHTQPHTHSCVERRSAESCDLCRVGPAAPCHALRARAPCAAGAAPGPGPWAAARCPRVRSCVSPAQCMGPTRCPCTYACPTNGAHSHPSAHRTRYSHATSTAVLLRLTSSLVSAVLPSASSRPLRRTHLWHKAHCHIPICQATSSVSRERSRSHEPGRDQTTATSRGGGKC